MLKSCSRCRVPLPKLNEAQVEWIIQQVAAYIERQRQFFGHTASPLDANQTAAMLPCFPASTLDTARVVVLAGKRVSNPPFYDELINMGFDPSTLPDFAHMAAITFLDTVVSHEEFTDRLLFHELVHVVQYQKLGLTAFATKYVRGFLSGGSYERIPLEMNAYELEAEFAGAPWKTFSVADEVQSWIDSDKF